MEIPSSFPRAFSGKTTFIEETVLNTKYVSVPTGSEHFSFHTKNSNEEQLFKVEDERYEYNQFISICKNTYKCLKEINDDVSRWDLENRQALRDHWHKIKAYQMGWILHLYDTEEKRDSIKVYMDEDFPNAIRMILETLWN